MAKAQIVFGEVGGGDKHYIAFPTFDSVYVNIGFEPKAFMFRAYYGTGNSTFIDHIYDKTIYPNQFLQINYSGGTASVNWRTIGSSETIVGITANGFELSSNTYNQYHDAEILAIEV